MSLRRTMHRASAEVRLAERIGEAIAEYGRAGGSLPHLAKHLLRYAAQCFLMGRAEPKLEDFVTLTDEAFRAELASLIEKAEKTGKG